MKVFIIGDGVSPEFILTCDYSVAEKARAMSEAAGEDIVIQENDFSRNPTMLISVDITE